MNINLHVVRLMILLDQSVCRFFVGIPIRVVIIVKNPDSYLKLL